MNAEERRDGERSRGEMECNGKETKEDESILVTPFPSSLFHLPDSLLDAGNRG